MTDPDWLKPIVEAEKAATEGPWVFSGDLCNGNHLEREGVRRPPIIDAIPCEQWQCEVANGRFIALFRNETPRVRDMLRLLAEAAQEAIFHRGSPSSQARLCEALEAYETGVLPKGD